MDLVIWHVYLELEGIQIKRMQKIEGIGDNNVVIRLMNFISITSSSTQFNYTTWQKALPPA